MRLFTGIALPPGDSEALAQAARLLPPPELPPKPSVRWTQADDMHITLVFLGEIDHAAAGPLTTALAKIEFRPLPLRVTTPGIFHGSGVLIARVELSPELAALAEQVAVACRQLGFQLEDRPYQPHITLARSKALRRFTIAAPPSWPICAFTAEAFHLYRSTTANTGARYQKLASFPLHASGGKTE